MNYKKLFTSFFSVILGAYVALIIYFYVAQHDIILHPTVLPEDHAYTYSFDYEERWFDVEDGARIHAIHAKTPDSLRGVVLFIHGNAGSNETRSERFLLFLNQGYDVVYPDYRGFGKSTGEVQNEEDLIGDMRDVYDVIKGEYGEPNVFIVGYSLGSGVAAQVAVDNDPKGLMLWTPYYSMVDMKDVRYPYLPDLILKYPLRTDKALPKIEEPITIFYAEDDEVLPYLQAKRLNELLKPDDNYYVLEGQGHDNVFLHAELIGRIPSILNRQAD
ncbi:MAG TPA: hypothetical protein DEQ34_13765 [Balneolaceae bacterium]|nr:hypothetical protein [Balneolaceae bacterium]|tara:strand:- start:1607 stop:2425 length:819 start_codon:yes stop_codon:yes gene_type:complete